jgi:hypothetical protein
MNQDAPNIWLPQPPHVSGPAQQQPRGAVGNTGVIYGTQQRAVWQPGATDARQVCDALKPQSLWRFSVFGRVSVTLDYGTQANRGIVNLLAPLVITIPGQFTATATPLDAEGVEAVVTLTQATAGARSLARNVLNAGAGPALAFDLGAVSYVALTASTLTISGVAVVVPALGIVPLVSGSVLNTGAGFQEFET